MASRGTSISGIAEKIKSDSDFILLTESLEKFSESEKDRELIKRLLVKKDINEADRERLAKAFGFVSVEEVYDFDVRNFQYLSNI